MDKEELTKNGIDRYKIKRQAGISNVRYDGSLCSEENDIQSSAAEHFAAGHYGVDYRSEIMEHGDGGIDFTLSFHADVVWLGVDENGNPREDGHLIINPEERQRWSDVYIVIKGSIDSGFEVVGWTTHNDLIKEPKKNFGHGLKFAMHISKLNKSDLRDLKINKTFRDFSKCTDEDFIKEMEELEGG